MKNPERLMVASILTLIGVAVFSVTYMGSVFSAPEREVESPLGNTEVTSTQNIPAQAYPQRIFIPVLNINTVVHSVGVVSNGNMALPPNFTDVAWYKYGTVPGYKGSAVIAGHLDNGLGLPAVFKYLDRLSKGHEIFIMKKDGSWLRFEVTEIEKYPYNQVPVNEVFLENDNIYLKLVTCTGDWIKSKKTYDERVIVTAVLKNK